LRPLRCNWFELAVPETATNGVVAFQALDFEILQRRFPIDSPSNRVTPELLGPRTRLAMGERSCVALVQTVEPIQSQRDLLLPLPRATKVARGSTIKLEAPVLLKVGTAAVSVLPGGTIHPASSPGALPTPRLFRIPDLGVPLAAVRELDDFTQAEVVSVLRVGGYDEPFTLEEAPRVGRFVLDRLKRHYAFVPALLDDREPRLVLLYERDDNSVGFLLSDAEVASWTRELERLLQQVDGRVSARPRRSSNPPPLTEWPSAMFDAKATRLWSTPVLNEAPSARLNLSRDLSGECYRFGSLTTRSPQFAGALRQVQRIAHTDLKVLFLGESGTGKEHLARALHEASKRAHAPFSAINCSAIPEALIESELFGHKKGAFTGTQSERQGAFRAADGGTLLLDEVGDAPLHVQLALLRVLETRRVKAVGADYDVPVNVRIIAATSRNIHELIAHERFRQDLYYRLAEMTVSLPPLRDRIVDLPQIAQALLDEMECTKRLTDDAIAALQRHAWPGNIRELRNTLHRAMYLTDTDVIDAAGLDLAEPRGVTQPAEEVGIEFNDRVRNVALALWHEQPCPTLSVLSQYERRALHRAALLYLSATYGRAAFPSSLRELWLSLFGERWATSENERGLRDVMRVLGYGAHDARVRGWIFGAM
jgi:MoxR-like ATPase